MPTMKYYSALKRRETSTPATTWVTLKDIKLRDTSNTKRQILYDSTYIQAIQKDKFFTIPLIWGV